MTYLNLTGVSTGEILRFNKLIFIYRPKNLVDPSLYHKSIHVDTVLLPLTEN